MTSTGRRSLARGSKATGDIFVKEARSIKRQAIDDGRTDGRTDRGNRRETAQRYGLAANEESSLRRGSGLRVKRKMFDISRPNNEEK